MHKEWFSTMATYQNLQRNFFKNADTQVPTSRAWDLVDEVGRGGQAAVSFRGSQAKTADKAHGIPRLYLLHSQQIAPHSVCLVMRGVFLSRVPGNPLVWRLARA